MANNDDPFAIGSWDNNSTNKDSFGVTPTKKKESNPFEEASNYTLDFKKVHERAQERRKDPNFDPFGSLLAKGIYSFIFLSNIFRGTKYQYRITAHDHIAIDSDIDRFASFVRYFLSNPL